MLLVGKLRTLPHSSEGVQVRQFSECIHKVVRAKVYRTKFSADGFPHLLMNGKAVCCIQDR